MVDEDDWTKINYVGSTDNSLRGMAKYDWKIAEYDDLVNGCAESKVI